MKRPSLHERDRIFWVWLSRLWRDWRSCLVLVQPETVIAWHRQGFKLYWRWKSSSQAPGQPKVKREIRNLICRMSKENPTWGAPREEGTPQAKKKCTSLMDAPAKVVAEAE